MPPIKKFTKEKIINSSVEIIRKNGRDFLSARNIAKELGSSTKPIFAVFNNMEELNIEIINYCKDIYTKYVNMELNNYKDKPYKAYGMGYIKFAMEERELFKFLYMRDRVTNETLDKQECLPIIDMISKKTGLDRDKAYLFHIEMWLFIHGIATTIVTNYANWDIEFISNMLTDQFIGMKKRFLN